MEWYTKVWAAWILMGLVFEIYVLVRGIDGATLSEQVWKLRESGSGWFSLLMFFMAWMIYHFIRENVGNHGGLPPPVLPEVPLNPPDTTGSHSQ